MNNRVIVMPVNDRPQVLSATLQCLANNYFIEDWLILFCCEPSNRECIRMCQDWRHSCRKVYVNHHTLGIGENQYQAFVKGFGYANYVVYLEDDLLVAKDFLQLMRWMGNAYWDDITVFQVTGASLHKDTSDLQFDKLIRRERYFSISVGLWRDRFLEPSGIYHNWHNHVEWCKLNNIKPTFHWSFIVKKWLQGYRMNIGPAVSRVKHIGLHGDNFTGSQDYLKDVLWAGDYEYEMPKEYVEEKKGEEK